MNISNDKVEHRGTASRKEGIRVENRGILSCEICWVFEDLIGFFTFLTFPPAEMATI